MFKGSSFGLGGPKRFLSANGGVFCLGVRSRAQGPEKAVQVEHSAGEGGLREHGLQEHVHVPALFDRLLLVTDWKTMLLLKHTLMAISDVSEPILPMLGRKLLAVAEIEDLSSISRSFWNPLQLDTWNALQTIKSLGIVQIGAAPLRRKEIAQGRHQR